MAKVEVSITDTTDDEAEALRLRLAELKEKAAPDGPEHDYTSMEDAYAAQIKVEVQALAARVREGRVLQQRALGEVMVQLPPGDQAELIGQLISKARANDIDVSALEPQP